MRGQVTAVYPSLDPIRLLQDIRAGQPKLVEIADAVTPTDAVSLSAPTIDQFLASLKTTWRDGDPNPTARARPKAPRSRRRPDPLAAVNDQIESWFTAEPWRTARELLERLQVEHPQVYRDGHLRTLQRRLKVLRRRAALSLVPGSTNHSGASLPLSENLETRENSEPAFS